MATFIISKRTPVTDKQRKAADSFMDAAVHWSELAADESKQALSLSEDSLRHATYATECLNEAAKLLGFKNTDEMKAYMDKHGTI